MKNPEASDYNLFLLGAGFTKAVFPDAPLNECLLQAVMNYKSSLPLQKYCREYKTDNIEILLTRLDLETAESQSEQLKQDRQKINAEIAEYFQQFRFGKHGDELKNKDWLKKFANSVLAQNDIIINLNYDCVLDGVLDYYKVWSPSKGYGAADVKVEVPGTAFESLENPKNILIYKIHGSENFRTTEIDTSDIDKTKIGLLVNKEIYPESGKNSNLEGGNKPYIIAPSFVKTFYPQVERMMIGALCDAAKAKNFIIIGCGLRPEDSFLYFLLTHFLSQNDTDRSTTEDKSIIIVDPKAEEIKARINDHYFGGIDGFSVKAKPFSNGLASDCACLIERLNNSRKLQNK